MVLSPEQTEQANGILGELRLPYVPHEPTAKQEWFMLQDALEVFFGGAAGPGKAAALTELVATTDGWTTMQDIRCGDRVFDADGQPREVLAVGPVQFGRPCMKIVWSDGAQTVCDEQHEWLTMSYLERAQAARRTPEFRARRRKTRASKASGRKSEHFTASLAARNASREYELLDPPELVVRETREIAGSLLHHGRTNHSVPVSAPLALPHADLPMDPYTLGVWLGDGSSKGGLIANDPRDNQIIECLPYASHRTGNPIVVRVDGLTALLRRAGVYGDKHIPTAYLRASFEQRLAVLQGIVDTDGHVDKRDGRVEVTLTRWRLIEGLCELIATLGIRYSVHEGRATLDGRDIGPRWRVAFQTGLPVARLARKLEAQHRGPFRRWHDHRYVVAVERVASVPVRCITVEGGVYLTGERMIPTHNSWGLLMSAAQYVETSGYNALLLRPSLTEFKQQSGLIEISHEWFGSNAADAPHWNGSDLQWTFPSRASIKFGYLANMADLSHYKGGGIAYVGFDELTSFQTERLYTSMFRMLRRGANRLPPGIPLRMRSASNPGDVGHHWVKQRFVDALTREKDAVYIPAKMGDNPYLDVEEYLKSLSHMHPVDRQRLIDGDWDVLEEGNKFKRHDFEIIPLSAIVPAVKTIRYWDLAGTEPHASNTDPDYTVGLLYEVDAAGFFTIRDVTLGQWADDRVEQVVAQTAAEDGIGIDVYIEQDPGQAGKSQLGNYKRKVLQGFPVHAGQTKINGQNAAKEVRARPAAAAVGNHLVRIAQDCKNIRPFLDQVCMFPNAAHDDCVDAFSGAHNSITGRASGVIRTTRQTRRIPTSEEMSHRRDRLGQGRV